MSEGVLVENEVDGIPTSIPQGQGDVKRGQTYVRDLTKSVLLALDVDRATLKHRVFNLGGDFMSSDRDVAQIVKEFIPEAKITIRKDGISRRVLSTQLARDKLGWKSTYDLKNAIKTI